MKLRIDITVELDGLSPRQVRESVAEALRAAVMAEYETGRIDIGVAEELRRVLPKPERA